MNIKQWWLISFGENTVIYLNGWLVYSFCSESTWLWFTDETLHSATSIYPLCFPIDGSKQLSRKSYSSSFSMLTCDTEILISLIKIEFDPASKPKANTILCDYWVTSLFLSWWGRMVQQPLFCIFFLKSEDKMFLLNGGKPVPVNWQFLLDCCKNSCYPHN